CVPEAGEAANTLDPLRRYEVDSTQFQTIPRVTEGTTMPYNHLLTCPTHGKSPAGLLCRHVADKTATTAVRIQPQGQEGVDYLCEQCVVRAWALDIEDMVVVCMYCARECVKGLTISELDEFAALNPGNTWRTFYDV